MEGKGGTFERLFTSIFVDGRAFNNTKMPSTLSKLHHAAATGSVERTPDFLSGGSSDIDRAGGDDAWTPLMFAADVGYV